MAKTTITTGTTITTAETTTTITITTTITTEAPTPATETPATETPTPATETPAEAPTPATETPTTGALPAPTEIATTTEVPAAKTATAATEIVLATALQEMQDAHEKAVNFCVELESDDFAELIRYAQHRNNKFPAYAVQLRDVINADDVYKDAICRICEPLGEEVVRKAIKLVDSKKILDLAEYLKYVKTIVEEWGDI